MTRPRPYRADRLQVLAVPELVNVDDAGAELPALLLARRGGRVFVAVRRGWGDSVLRWLPSTDVRAPSAGGDEQALRPDPERSTGVGQHTGRKPRAAR